MPIESAETPAQTQLFEDSHKSTTELNLEVIKILNLTRATADEMKDKQAKVLELKNKLKTMDKQKNDLLDIINRRNNVEFIFIPSAPETEQVEETTEGPSDDELAGFMDDENAESDVLSFPADCLPEDCISEIDNRLEQQEAEPINIDEALNGIVEEPVYHIHTNEFHQRQVGLHDENDVE